MEKVELPLDIIKAIEKTLEKGNTAEVKKRKDDIIVLSVKRKREDKNK